MAYNTGTPNTSTAAPMSAPTDNPLGTPAATPTAAPAATNVPREMAFLARGVPPGLGDPVRGGMSEQARLAQQRRNTSFSRAQAPRFNQFTGGGAKYIGAQDGEVLYDYGNGQYRKGTNPNNLRDAQGNWTFLRS